MAAKVHRSKEKKITTLNFNSRTSSQLNFRDIGLLSYKSISDRESVSLALAQMKVTTGALERQQQDTPPKGNGFYRWWPQIIAFSLSIQICPYVVFCSHNHLMTSVGCNALLSNTLL